jgi:site-specific DNA-methyltransferase (adenine-specific)
MKPSTYVFVFFGFEAYPSFLKSLRDAGFEADHEPLIWDKCRTTTPFSGYNFPSCYEPIMVAYKPPRERRLQESQRKVLQYKTLASQHKIHPFEKPLDLLERLIRLTTFSGETVLDPFAGSGSTLVAAKQSGRGAIGFESSKDHYLQAYQRLTTSSASKENFNSELSGEEDE